MFTDLNPLKVNLLASIWSDRPNLVSLLPLQAALYVIYLIKTIDTLYPAGTEIQVIWDNVLKQ